MISLHWMISGRDRSIAANWRQMKRIAFFVSKVPSSVCGDRLLSQGLGGKMSRIDHKEMEERGEKHQQRDSDEPRLDHESNIQ